MERPSPQENLPEAMRRAFQALEGRAPEELAECAGGRASGNAVEVTLLGRDVVVDLDAHEVRSADTRVDDATGAVVARYLMLCDRLPQELGEDIGFADSADARGYLGPFRGRVIAPLVGRFGRDPEGFARAAEALGGERVRELEGAGGVACRLPVLPRFRVTFILHPGDEEFAAEGQALFPRAAFDAFAVDDVVAMAALASRALRTFSAAP